MTGVREGERNEDAKPACFLPVFAYDFGNFLYRHVIEMDKQRITNWR